MSSTRVSATIRSMVSAAAVATALAVPSPGVAAETKLLWGDTHLHTSYSFDAFLNNNLSVDPDYAYRFAKGIPVMHPYHRAWMRLEEPLDFLVVSDHAEFIGAIRSIYVDGLPREDVGIVESIRNWYATRQLRGVIDEGQGPAFFQGILPPGADPRDIAAAWGDRGGGSLPAPPPGVFRAAWGEIVDAAEAHYQPGSFTSIIGWEWTSTPGGANLHRVVLTDAGAEQARSFQPVSAAQSPYPDDLWAWLDETSAATGARFLSIPHNSNVSKGMMFPDITLRGAPVDADHARARMRWERIIEVTQIKGDSETHPLLSPDDEFADFETFPFHLQGDTQEYIPEAGDYARPALGRGLALGAAVGINPFQFGMIGSTDSHSGLSTPAEDDFGGKMATDSIPERKDDVVTSGDATGWTMSASGLAAVWAEDNTREAIVDAMHRRETYGTSGPRIRVRFFGGWEFSEADLEGEDVAAAAYGKGVSWVANSGRRPTAARPASSPWRTRTPPGRTWTASRSSRAGSTRTGPRTSRCSTWPGPGNGSRGSTESCRPWATPWTSTRPGTRTPSVRWPCRRCGRTRPSRRGSTPSTTSGSSRFPRRATRSTTRWRWTGTRRTMAPRRSRSGPTRRRSGIGRRRSSRHAGVSFDAYDAR